MGWTNGYGNSTTNYVGNNTTEQHSNQGEKHCWVKHSPSMWDKEALVNHIRGS